MGDHLWMARFLLLRIGEEWGIKVSEAFGSQPSSTNLLSPSPRSTPNPSRETGTVQDAIRTFRPSRCGRPAKVWPPSRPPSRSSRRSTSNTLQSTERTTNSDLLADTRLPASPSSLLVWPTVVLLSEFLVMSVLKVTDTWKTDDRRRTLTRTESPPSSLKPPCFRRLRV